MKEQELERMYLAARLPEGLTDAPSKEIFDIYLPSHGQHPVLRIRKAGTKMEMTKKEPIASNDYSVQLEQTIPLTEAEYAELSTLQGKRVIKTRYYYEFEGRTYEVGVFGGALQGLVLIDVEFSSQEEMRTFVAPDFCLVEVTEARYLAGGELCGSSYADIAQRVESLGYRPIF